MRTLQRLHPRSSFHHLNRLQNPHLHSQLFSSKIGSLSPSPSRAPILHPPHPRRPQFPLRWNIQVVVLRQNRCPTSSHPIRDPPYHAQTTGPRAHPFPVRTALGSSFVSPRSYPHRDRPQIPQSQPQRRRRHDQGTSVNMPGRSLLSTARRSHQGLQSVPHLPACTPGRAQINLTTGCPLRQSFFRTLSRLTRTIPGRQRTKRLSDCRHRQFLSIHLVNPGPVEHNHRCCKSTPLRVRNCRLPRSASFRQWSMLCISRHV